MRMPAHFLRDLGVKLWTDAWLSQLDAPEQPGWHGAILHGLNPALRALGGGPLAGREHLRHDPGRIAKCTLWFMVNHVFAARQLLRIVPE